jgi:two-component system response regulator DesR
MSIRVVLVEDQALVRGALGALLRLADNIDVIGEAGDGRAGFELVERLKPDVLLTDIEMPKMTGLELARLIKERALATRVIIVTTFGRAGYLRRALECNVAGYLLKDAPSDQLAESIRRVVAGGRAIDPELAMAGWEGDDPLTDRERQVLRLAGDGKSSADIAALVHLSEGTVRNYLSEAIAKLGAANRVDAARLARHKGWL